MDKARKKTDKILSNMEKEVSRIYTRASKEISEEWDKYMTSHKKILDQAYNDLNEAKELGDKALIKSAQEKYDRTVRNITLNNNRYRAMVNETATRLSHVNEIALDYVNDNMPKIYTINYNAFSDQDIKGYSFTLVNEQAIRNLATENASLLPKKKIDIPKDMAWNTKKINSEVLQGILQGESIAKIAKRLAHVTDMNKNSSIRNARTMTTGAENKGRQDSFIKATNDGIIMEREWIATFDERTRAWHADLNGVRVAVDEPWENDYGEIMYPGDPSAHPANVYNCRCSIRAHIKGFAWSKSNESTLNVTSPDINFNADAVSLIYEYASRMNAEDVTKFNNIFAKAEFVESNDVSCYDPISNKIYLNPSDSSDTIFHESTHWFDNNQHYDIVEDRGRFTWALDENGDLTGERKWQSDLKVIKSDASFSEYIQHKWESYEIDANSGTINTKTKMDDDYVNISKKLGLSGNYGNDKSPDDIINDMHGIDKYLSDKGISKTDPDYVPLSDFISAITYDSNLGSAITGGHSYDYWVEDNLHRVNEITAGYNLLRATGRTDFIEIEKDLAPNLMNLIEKEWKKIW